MRFERLRLAPFGAFEDAEFAFPRASEGPDLHVVHGPNGAGKTTTLEALHSTLFGIHPSGAKLRTMSFRFPSNKLRLRAKLSRADGQTIEFTRRSARKSPIFDAADDQALAPEALDPFTAGLNLAEFRSLYGLDLEQMERGGQELLQGDGDIGKALFGASLGAAELAEITARLEEEVDGLWTPRGHTRRINQLLSQLDDLRREIKDEQLSSSAYSKRRSELRRLRERDEEIEAEMRRIQREARALDDLARAVRQLEPLERKEAELRAFGDAEPLAPDAAERVREAENERKENRDRIATRAQERARREEERVGVATRAGHAILECSNDVDALSARRGAYRTALERRDELRAAALEAREARDRAAGRSSLKLDTTDGPEALARAIDRLRDDIREAQRDRNTAIEAHDLAESALVRASERVASARDDASTEFASALDDLRPFVGEWSELESLPLPADGDVERAAREHESLEDDAKQLDAEHERLEDDVAKAEARAEDLARSADAPPTADELAAARERRDERLRNALGAAARGDAIDARDAVDAPRLVAEADALADRIAARSNEAAQRGSAERELADLRRRLEANEAAIEQLRTRREESREAWADRLRPAGLDALLPSEFVKWRERRTDLLARYREFEAAARGHEGDARTARDEAAAALEVANAARNDALAAWRAWAEARGLSPDEDPDATRDAIRASTDLVARERDLTRADEELRDAVETIESFEADARDLRTRAGLPPPTETSDVERIDDVLEALDDAKDARRRLADIDVRLKELGELDAVAERRVAELGGSLEREAQEASLDSVDALLERLEKSEAIRSVQRDRDSMAEAFDKVAGGRTGDELRAELADRSVEDLEAEATGLREEANAHSAKRAELAQEIGALKSQLDVDDSSRAAARRADAANIEAEIETCVEAWLHARIARSLLDRQVEAYRKEARGPILLRSGELFAALTDGAYETLLIDPSDGRERIVARRSGDREEVAVGGMSTGTENQLYLALRIASVEHTIRTQSNEPMPFLADDLFVHFDDERTTRSLQVLAELARTTQVVVFTHHDAVVRSAMELPGTTTNLIELASERARESD